LGFSISNSKIPPVYTATCLGITFNILDIYSNSVYKTSGHFMSLFTPLF
jgi:hypothetical protein